MNPLTTATLLLTVGLCSGAFVRPPYSGDKFELLILHNNDMHARFEQTSQLSGACTAQDREAGKCYGGFPRVAHVVKEAREAAKNGQGPPVLYLNAGDTYTGTAWFTIYKWKIAAEFINALQPDAVSLGNHEFDEEINGLLPFIRNLSSPVLASNLILNKVPELAKEENLKPYIIKEIAGKKIAIIGYLTSDTKFLAPKNLVEYSDEVESIQYYVNILRSQGVDIFIALGHSGIVKDIEIAKNVMGLDLVIGGHSNTFLWNNKTTNQKPEVPQGPYPLTVTQNDGRIVRVVQAYAYTKYLGKLRILFNENGDIIECDGNPILLDNSIPRDPEVLKIVEKYRQDIDLINNVIIGSSMVALKGDYCRIKECNMGNLITDAMLDYTHSKYKNVYTTDIAIIQGGRIRTSLDRPEKPFNMTRGDWVTVMPFTDALVVVTMNGTVLKEALEHAVDGWREIDSPGQFLQFSGVKVVYDLSKPSGSRVEDIQAKCLSCEDKFMEVKDDLQYNILMSNFLANGGDGFSMFENLDKEIVPYNEVDCLVDYFNKTGPIKHLEEGRITLLNLDNVNAESITYNIQSSSIKLMPFTLWLIAMLILPQL